MGSGSVAACRAGFLPLCSPRCARVGGAVGGRAGWLAVRGRRRRAAGCAQRRSSGAARRADGVGGGVSGRISAVVLAAVCAGGWGGRWSRRAAGGARPATARGRVCTTAEFRRGAPSGWGRWRRVGQDSCRCARRGVRGRPLSDPQWATPLRVRAGDPLSGCARAAPAAGARSPLRRSACAGGGGSRRRTCAGTPPGHDRGRGTRGGGSRGRRSARCARRARRGRSRR
ncbi:hypothetical protein QE410_000246 [Microbacterium sp. SORGH_AS 1204]|nr:hypothetical protein [Microbacterium sp. SORGH_AS_1204]